MGITYDEDDRDPFAGIPAKAHEHLDHVTAEEWGGRGEQKTLVVLAAFRTADGRDLVPGDRISPNEARKHHGISTREVK